MRLDPISGRPVFAVGAGLPSFREWLRRLEGTGRLPPPEVAVERWEEEYERRQEALDSDPAAARAYEDWLRDHELAVVQPMTSREQLDHAKRIVDWGEGDEIPRLKREIDKLEAAIAGGGAEKASSRSRLAKLRVELSYVDRLVDEIFAVAYPAHVGPSFGVSWAEVEARRKGKDVHGFPLLDCHRCRRRDAFENERAKFNAGRRGCDRCRESDREHNEEAARRRNEPTWLDHLKAGLETEV